jgi:GDPmannose 4,6-dehydratase
MVDNYREAYNLFASTGILFNHESLLRPERFVTTKIVKAACRIAAGEHSKLTLGNLSIARDWGWAPEYIEAMWLMLQQDSPDDFVIATGEQHTLDEFVCMVFSCLNLDWREHVLCDSNLFRPSEIMFSCGNPRKAFEILGWQANTHMEEVVRKLVREEKICMGIE